MPERLFQTLGDDLTRALVTGDFDLYAAIMALPLTIAPRDGAPYVLADRAALRADFDLYHSIIKLHGVTDIYREVVEYQPVSDGHIRFHFVTHILVRAQRIVEPFASCMLMVRGADGWRIAEIESSEGHINWTRGRARIAPDGTFLEGKH